MDRRLKGVLGFMLGLMTGLLATVLVAAFASLPQPFWLAQAILHASLP
jgi:hypothetical protein